MAHDKGKEAERAKQAGLQYAAAACVANLCCHRSCAEAVMRAELLPCLLPLLQPHRGQLSVPSVAWMLGGGKTDATAKVEKPFFTPSYQLNNL